MDNKRGHLRADQHQLALLCHPAVQIEFKTRARDVQLESLSMSLFVKPACVCTKSELGWQIQSAQGASLSSIGDQYVALTTIKYGRILT
jgi:hypothetical protein